MGTDGPNHCANVICTQGLRAQVNLLGVPEIALFELAGIAVLIQMLCLPMLFVRAGCWRPSLVVLKR